MDNKSRASYPGEPRIVELLAFRRETSERFAEDTGETATAVLLLGAANIAFGIFSDVHSGLGATVSLSIAQLLAVFVGVLAIRRLALLPIGADEPPLAARFWRLVRVVGLSSLPLLLAGVVSWLFHPWFMTVGVIASLGLFLRSAPAAFDAADQPDRARLLGVLMGLAALGLYQALAVLWDGLAMALVVLALFALFFHHSFVAFWRQVSSVDPDARSSAAATPPDLTELFKGIAEQAEGYARYVESFHGARGDLRLLDVMSPLSGAREPARLPPPDQAADEPVTLEVDPSSMTLEVEPRPATEPSVVGPESGARAHDTQVDLVDYDLRLDGIDGAPALSPPARDAVPVAEDAAAAAADESRPEDDGAGNTVSSPHAPEHVRGASTEVSAGKSTAEPDAVSPGDAKDTVEAASTAPDADLERKSTAAVAPIESVLPEPAIADAPGAAVRSDADGLAEPEPEPEPERDREEETGPAESAPGVEPDPRMLLDDAANAGLRELADELFDPRRSARKTDRLFRNRYLDTEVTGVGIVQRTETSVRHRSGSAGAGVAVLLSGPRELHLMLEVDGASDVDWEEGTVARFSCTLTDVNAYQRRLYGVGDLGALPEA